jgi:cytochrome c oxidase subunit 6a
MFTARQMLRQAAPRLSAQLRAPVMRNVVQRRFASSTENNFVKEREAVKEHAAGSTGMFLVLKGVR